MLTPDEKKQLQTLRDLQKEIEYKQGMYDRPYHNVTPERLRAEVNAIKAQINALPEIVHRFAEREDILEKLGFLIEDYILHRARRFLPDPQNLLDTIHGFDQNHEIPQTELCVGRVMVSLARLRTLETPREDIDVVILVAENLDQYRAKPLLYLNLLKIAARSYLDRRAELIEETAPRGLAGLFSSAPADKIEDLVESLPEWKMEIPSYRNDYHLWERLENSPDLKERVGYARFNLIRQMQPLSRLGLSDQMIEERLSEIQKQWQVNHSKKRK